MVLTQAIEYQIFDSLHGLPIRSSLNTGAYIETKKNLELAKKSEKTRQGVSKIANLDQQDHQDTTDIML